MKEIDRILTLPIIPEWGEDERAEIRSIYTGRTITLRDVQCDALYSIRIYGGGFFPIGVGYGKTIIALLAYHILQCPSSIYLMPNPVHDQLYFHDIPFVEREFGIKLNVTTLDGLGKEGRCRAAAKNPGLKLIPYSLLSVTDTYEFLSKTKTQCILADECHFLRHRNSARTKRLLNFLRDSSKIKLICLSGTITKNSLLDYSHLIQRSLGENNPLPNSNAILNEWDELLHPDNYHKYVTHRELIKIHAVATGKNMQDRITQEAARTSFKWRLHTAPGVVATEGQSVDCSIYLNPVYTKIPVNVQDALEELNETWVDPNGDEIVDMVVKTQMEAQLVSGFYYKLTWPEGITKETIDAHDAKMLFYRMLRMWLKRGPRVGHDTPLLAMRALAKKTGYVNELQDEYDMWKFMQKDWMPKRVRSTNWISDYKLREAFCWAVQAETGIIWYKWDVFGEEVFRFLWANDMRELVQFCPANCPIDKLMQKDKILVCSMAHAIGKNLQHYDQQLVLDVPRNAQLWEQMLGRTHRQGQKSDLVSADIICGTEFERDGIRKSLKQAKFIEETGGGSQKLLIASWSKPEDFLSEIRE